MTAPVIAIDLPGGTKIRSGKVREVFDVGDAYLLVATDRISAFDCVLPVGIPGKGRVLNMLSAWWFRRLEHIFPHHLITLNVDEYPAALRPYRDLLHQRSMLVTKTKVFPVECVARGYLIGSGWMEYCARGEVCGESLPPGLSMASRLETPVFTPATKADNGHDENISFARMVTLIGADDALALKQATLSLYREAANYTATRGVLLADTKFEFGRDARGTIRLIDEALTPDSSRYWPAHAYQAGSSPPSLDKQIVRDYLESIPWNKSPPAPVLPPEIIARTAATYREVYTLITGEILDD